MSEISSETQIQGQLENPSPMVTVNSDSNESQADSDEESQVFLDNEQDPASNPDATQTQHSEQKESDVAEPVRFFTKRKLKYQTPASSLEPLPEGWVSIPHCTGVPFYLHKTSKVITWSRPYVVSMGGIRRHHPPLASFPCLENLKNKNKIENEMTSVLTSETANGPDQANNTTNGITTDTDDNLKPETEQSEIVPKAILHNCENEILDEGQMMEYFNKRFIFDTVEVPHFNKWTDKRKYAKQKKYEANTAAQDNLSEPKKLGPAKVITLTIPRDGAVDRPHKVVFNTSIKPMVCVMHEYAQSILRTQPQYKFATKDDSSEPFEATVMINDKAYGTACGINKKAAKNKAALATMEILVPGFKDQVDNLSGETSVEYFNDVSVTDHRVYDLCVHAGNYLPYQLLTECLKRNQGIADTSVHFDVQIGKGKNIEYKMTCGKHVVTGTAKNKKMGKQVAAQQILQLLHPKVTSWGELIKSYGTSVAEKRARKKNIEQEIFELKQRRSTTTADSSMDESNASVLTPDESSASSSAQRSSTRGRETRETAGPNPELLAKLRKMMEELGESRSGAGAKKNDAEDATKDGEPARKKSKLLLIDV